MPVPAILAGPINQADNGKSVNLAARDCDPFFKIRLSQSNPVKPNVRNRFDLALLLTLISGCALPGPAPRSCAVTYPGAIPFESAQPMPRGPLIYEAPLEEV